jgi:Protein of unknown function (DUF1254)
LGQNTPGYNQKIPEKIMTPDKVETRLGTLNFVDGVPTAETTQKVYDNLDFLRGVEVFLNLMPAASMEGLRLGAVERGATKSNQFLLFDQLMDSNPLFLTGNTDTLYCLGFLDLETDGPTVVEIPAGCGPGTCDDAFFPFRHRHGLARSGSRPRRQIPDRPSGLQRRAAEGQEGRRRILRRAFTLVCELGTLRGFLVDGKTDAAACLPRFSRRSRCHASYWST